MSRNPMLGDPGAGVMHEVSMRRVTTFAQQKSRLLLDYLELREKFVSLVRDGNRHAASQWRPVLDGIFEKLTPAERESVVMALPKGVVP